MLQFAYWNNWQKPYRILFIVLLAMLAGSIIYFVVSYIYGTEFVVEWILTPALEQLQVPLQAWQHPLQDVQVLVDTWVVKQIYWGGPLQINTTAAAISLTVFLLGLAIILACLTTFSRLWYLAGVTAFCGVVVLLRLEQLGSWGRFDNTATAAVFILLLPLSYYFQAVRTHTAFLVRLAAFSALIALLTLAIGYGASVPNPVLYVVNYGIPAWLALSFLLMILVGPEIIAGILYLVTASATPNSTGSLRHFTIASALYLLNLIFYYLTDRQYLDLGIYYIGPYWILLISIITGLWTLRLRRETLGAILQAEPYGLIMYVALAMITLSTLAYASATANDPLLESLEDAILYTHIGMGAALLLYILANFYALLRQNQRVYRVLYRPQYMPLFTARLAGLIIIFGLYSVRGNWAYFQPVAGYYNAIGDLYAAQNDLITSQNYYRLGSQYQIRNHRSNYALATLALGANNPKPAAIYLKDAIERQPSPYAYATLANLYREQGLFFEALFTLRQGVKQFPLAGPLYNNLGLYYGNTQLTDSAFYFLRAAAGDDKSEEVALANMLGVLAQKGIALSPDSLLAWHSPNNLALQNNMLAMANRQGYQLRELQSPRQVLGSDSAAAIPLYLLNYALQRPLADSSLVRLVGDGYERAKNSALEEQWGMAYALLLYQLPDHYRAFGVMQDLADRSQFNNITYYKVLGQWALEQGAPRLAADWFEQAHMRGDATAGFYRALALAESGQAEAATEIWISLADSTLPARLQQRKNLALLAVSNTSLEDVPQQEQIAALRLHLRPGTLIPAETDALLSTISETPARADALIQLAETSLRAGDRAQAQAYLARLQELQAQLSPEQLHSIRALRLRHQLGTGSIARQQNGEAPTLHQLQLRASRELADGNATAALQLLREVTEATPFEEGAILQAVHLLNAQKQTEEAYAILRRALLLNSYSVTLLEAYALQSLNIGLDEYADETVERLQELSAPDRFSSFKEEYESLKARLESQQNW
ncbi:lipopolysaccharide assembly protein LapB [Cesiribacter sp. SM1]|uniref:tetratricopeptide repeat protein n=1 Tax=Cesiribacter sp. SM1 TaxID=2861196 RepID=UPI001CD1FACE|nr:hypothetical protein [Cesiribacter sp. SM1]